MEDNFDLKKFLMENKMEEAMDTKKVDEIYYKIIESLSKIARNLSDDEAYALHEKLKAFFNKTI